MDLIKEAFSKAKADIQELKIQLTSLTEEISQLKVLLPIQINQHIPLIQQTNRHENPTQKHQISPNSSFSTGNRGVPTDRQTNQQTDRHIKISSLNQLSNTLESLENIKRTLSSQFKALTKQEFLIFATLYQLENEGLIVDYLSIASKLTLSESSIRDYILKIIKKGIPIVKSKLNNKKIILSIPPEIKKIASLQAILTLKEI